MRVPKKIFTVATILAIALSLCSCHGAKKREVFEVPESFDTASNYEITFWAKNDTNKSQVNIYKKAISDFESTYPNIKVNLKLYTDYTKIYNDVITNISTDTTPNVCITYPDHIATYMTGEETVVPLDALIENEKYGLGGSELRFDGPGESEIVDKYLKECKLGENIYALPFMRSTEACYINKDFVEKLGYEVPDVLTWDFVWEVSEAAMEKDSSGNFKLNGQKVMIPFIYKSTDNMMIQMLKQSEAGYSNEAGEILLFNDETKDILKEVAIHAKSGAFSTFKISSYPANFLNAGQCIFAIDSTAGSTWMGAEAPLSDISEDAFVDFETAVRMIPQYDESKPYMISQGPSVCIFNKEDSGEVLASWLFAQYLLTNDVQIAYSQTEGYVPVTTKARDDDRFGEYLMQAGVDNDKHYEVKIAATKLLLDNTENTFVTPVFSGSASLREAAGALIENVTKSVRRKTVADDEYFEKLFADTVSLYRLDQQMGAIGKADLGPLPPTAKALICVLGLTWLCIGVYLAKSYIKSRKK